MERGNIRLKKLLIIIASVLCAIIILVALFIVCGKLHVISEYDFTQGESKNDDIVRINRWNPEPYTLYLYNDTLYFYSDQNTTGSFDNGVYKIKENNAIKIVSFSSYTGNGGDSYYVERPLCFINGHLVYCSMSDVSENDTVSSVDIETGDKNVILKGEKVYPLVYEVEYYAPVAENPPQSVVYQTHSFTESLGPYFTITSDNIYFHEELEYEKEMDRFKFGDFEYYWDGVWLVQSGTGEKIKTGSFYPGQIFEVSDGEYILIKRTDTSGFWSIDRNGTIKELFPALNGEKIIIKWVIHNKDLYVSARRYKKYDILDTRRFKNDSEEGFWKIDIQTGEKKKLSAEMYSSLDIYDDSGIVACTYSKDIVVLDFDGKTKAKILSGSINEHLEEFYRNHLSRAE
ncbi:MAG: hypothetical protein J6112_09695 [Clostridia bacterium]|nr:hypothetical protein [Clostridia bacterium]